MNALKRTLFIATLSALSVVNARAHGGGGGGSGGGSNGGGSGGGYTREEDNYRKLQNVIKKRMKIEARLQNPDLPPAKRVKLEKKVEKLREKEGALR